MYPVEFEQANKKFGPPSDLDESQCMTIPAYAGEIKGGSVDGLPAVVTAWKPYPWELEKLNAGEPIFLTFIGGLPPHYPSTSFEEATHPK